MKATVRTTLVLLILCAGVAWADDAKLEEIVAAPAPEAVEAEPDAAEAETEPAEDPAAKDLEVFEPDAVSVDCCACFYNCTIGYQICINSGYPPATCRAEERACERDCKRSC